MSPPPPPPPSPPSSGRGSSTAPEPEEPHPLHGDEDCSNTNSGSSEVELSSPLGGPSGDVVDVQGLGGTPRAPKDFVSDDMVVAGDGGGEGGDDGDDRISSISHPRRCETADDVSSLGTGNDDGNVRDLSSDSSFSLSLSHPMFHLPAAGSSSPSAAIVRDGGAGAGDDGTLQLSLPESFDDTFTIHGVPVSPAGAAVLYDDARASRDRFPPNSVDGRRRSRDQPRSGGAISGDQTGGRRRHSQKSVLHREWTEREKRALREAFSQNATFTSTAESSQPRLDGRDDDDLTLSELAVRLMRDRIAAERTRKVDLAVDVQGPLRRRVDELEYELQEASRARTVVGDRLGAARRELEARDEANRRLEGEVRELRSDAVELREKGRQCSVLEKRCQRSEGEAAELRRRIDERESALARSTEREEESTKRRLDVEEKLRTADGDAAVLRKEVDVLLRRVERAEADREKLDARLREAQSHKEDLVRQLMEVKERSRADCDARVAREVSQIRTEQSLAGKDVDELRRHVATTAALERENRLLVDARKDLTKQLDQVRNELTELRATHQDLVLHQSSMAADHEQSISKAREETKAKELEIAKLSVARDALSGDLKAAMLKNDHMRDQVLIHEKEFMKLEKDATSERRRLEEELSRKNEQLETYLEAEIQIDSETGDGRRPGTAGLLSDPRQRIQHTIEITRKCAKLKKRHDEMLSELETEKKKTSELEKKIKAYKDLGTVDTRQYIERRNDDLRRQPKAEICFAAEDSNTGEIPLSLDRRAQLETMLHIVDELKTIRNSSKDPLGTLKRDTHQNSREQLESSDQAYIASKPASTTPSEAKANMPNSQMGSTQESRHGAQKIDLSIHTVHHKGRVKQRRPWHFSPALS